LWWGNTPSPFAGGVCLIRSDGNRGTWESGDRALAQPRCPCVVAKHNQ
jgi:hypothetical protein